MSQFLSAAANALNAAISKPRSFKTPVPDNFGMTHSESFNGKAIVIHETRFAIGFWNVETQRKDKSGGVYDGNVEGFNRQQSIAQIIADLDRIFVSEKMSTKYVGLYQMAMRPNLMDTLKKSATKKELKFL